MVQIFYKGGTLKLSIKETNEHRQTFTVAVAAAIVVALILVALAIRTLVKKDETEVVPEIPTYALGNYIYEEMYADRDTDASLLKLVVCNPDGGAAPAVRAYPKIEDATYIGRIQSVTEIYVSKAWKIKGNSDNESWIGVSYSEISSLIRKPAENPIIDKSGIVWINGYYSDIYCRENDPGEYDNMDYKKYVRYQGEYVINVAECKLRSAPETGSDANVYGEIIEGVTIQTSIVYENGTNTFYGVPASAIRASMLEHRVGNVDNDPDGIVWFSVDYAGTINIA